MFKATVTKCVLMDWEKEFFSTFLHFRKLLETIPPDVQDMFHTHSLLANSTESREQGILL